MFKKKLKQLASALIIGAILMPAPPARADVTVAPLRVVFKGRERSAVVSLINLTDHPNTYRLGWKLYKMDEKGGYKPMPLDEKDPFSVSKMVIFSPRQVMIGADQHQLVRLSLRRPANLPEGEYRGHLTFTRLPPKRREPVGDSKDTPKGQKLMLDINLSFSIPIIVRNGSDDALKVELRDPKFEMTKKNDVTQPALTLDLTRVSGKFSTYGSLQVFWKKPGEEKEQKIGVLNNIALYPEITKRHISIPLNTSQVNAGTVRVVYLGKYESQGTTWAEKTFPVGG